MADCVDSYKASHSPPRQLRSKGDGIFNVDGEKWQPFVKDALQMEAPESKEVFNPSFLRALSVAGIRDRKFIRDQCINILLADRDTTAGTLSFLFLELSRGPDIVKKLRREIMETIGPEAMPSYKELKHLSYLKNTISEVLRLYPALPYNVRWSSRDTTLPRGGGPDGTQPIGIEKNTGIGYSTIFLHRRPDLYPDSPDPPDPQTFCPERWE
ncbi:MAG: hypothetical protein L6R40_006057 [Gallowayella cf. fulva]|nr:MAG: hypothetical protein L6R40_006057 [Xanthomendoza cf. fulva]